jgi:LmbE family N-acetylglucosaminyl deacetylase
MRVRRLTVVSPHLDDAVFSLGGTIATLADAGTDVSVLTIFAGDPESDGPPTRWQERSGFASRAQAAHVLRAEDEAACELLGARPVWLPFASGAPDDTILELLGPALSEADVVVVPGFPCTHEDHVRSAQLTAAVVLPEKLALYVEQPYATWRLLGGGVPLQRRLRALAALAADSRARRLQAPGPPPALPALGGLAWRVQAASSEHRRRKRRAMRCYESQWRIFSRFLLPGIALYERSRGGEELAFVGQVAASLEAPLQA